MKLVRSARDLCANLPSSQSIVVPEHGFNSARLKHVSLYVRRTELQAQEAIFINFDTAALYLSHMLEVCSKNP